MADLRELIKKWRIAAMNAGKARAKAFTRCADELERALAAQPAPAATTVPEGWQLVPNLATREMVQAACDQLGYPGGGRHVYAKSYAAMLAAAPTPQATKENHDV